MRPSNLPPLPDALRGAARAALGRVPGVNRVLAERDALRSEVNRLRHATARADDVREYAPPGHFYSPIPSQARVEADAARLFGPPPRALPGLDLREQAQLALLASFLPAYAELPFPAHRSRGFRYWFENPAYSWSDGIFLYAMLRHLRPRRVVEVGSGHSSSLTLDVNDRWLGGRAALTFVEPHPEVLRSLLLPGDERRVRIVEAGLQDAPRELFDALGENDVLFVDSTHVSKIGSDVNVLFFEILPRLAPGVHVHFHDIFYPFEYPREWIREGRAWSEAYLLRAFLSFNPSWEIVLMNTFLETFHPGWFGRHMPLCLQNPGGSIWIRRAA